MPIKIEFSEEASEEFRNAVDWYESKSNGLGLEFSDEIDATIERIQLDPERYLQITSNIRKIQMDKFPYSLFYAIEKETLVILRVFHNKRKPVNWILN